MYRKIKHRECRFRVIICRTKKIIQVVVMSADVNEVMMPAIISLGLQNRNKKEVGRSKVFTGFKAESPLIADKGDKEGVCYFF